MLTKNGICYYIDLLNKKPIIAKSKNCNLRILSHVIFQFSPIFASLITPGINQANEIGVINVTILLAILIRKNFCLQSSLLNACVKALYTGIITISGFTNKTQQDAFLITDQNIII